MYLSRKDIAQIANRVIRRYDSLAPPTHGIRRIDPMKIAIDILDLTVEYMKLSEDGSVLGITSYDAALVEITGSDTSQNVTLNGKTILIEKSLHSEEQRGRRNFTLAHELSHQILKLMFPKDYGVRYRKSGAVYYRDQRSRKAKIDWEEWQADTLAVEILMPRELISNIMRIYGFSDGFKQLNKIFANEEYRRFCRMANFLGVSKETLSIRLQQLGWLKENYLRNPYAVMDIYV